MDFILQPWPWYVAGPLIALSMFLMFYFGKKFGVSSNLETLCSIAGAGKLVDFFKQSFYKQIKIQDYFLFVPITMLERLPQVSKLSIAMKNTGL